MAVFRMVLGEQGKGVLRNLQTIKAPENSTVNDTLDAMTKHFTGKHTEAFASYKSHQCARPADKAVEDFVARLKQLRRPCGFCGPCHGKVLRNKLLYSINNIQLTKSMLQFTNCTFDDGFRLCRNFEATVHQLPKVEEGAVQRI